ncbi:unnamed protein product [Ceratitis capitata]|uniref:(Mediterranean fruit fly) hypothetical protein n=1 Tax=Ceratitis capitata TaxID=7213 RepID=A0A811UH65_CERCA|nr:unnamed protein product [Ceratitis capitata]
MDFNEFRNFGKGAIELLIRYLQNIRERDVLSSAAPFSLIHTLPNEMPERAENWQDILNDIETFLLPALTHWQSPNFHGFYPSSSSMGSIVGELLIAGIGVLGFNWHSVEGPGGGVILGSASEAVLIAVISAREHMVRCTKTKHPDRNERDIRAKLIAYASDQSNSCIEKAGKLAALPFNLLPTKNDFRLHAEQLEAAIKMIYPKA